MSLFGTVFQGNKRGFVLSAVAAFITFGAINVGPARAEEGIAWTKEVDKGLIIARQSNKYVLADVYTDWCGWCKRLDQQTFRDKSVSEYLGNKFICIKVNAEDHGQGETMAHKYQVNGFPCALVFNQSGKYIGRISGFMPPEQYQAKVKEILANPE